MTMIVGTSGWQYADWRAVFYPRGVAQRRWLEHYATSFATVELNAAFYRPVTRSTFEGWRERTPADFVMAVKASRVVTHYRRLVDVDLPLERSLTAASGLGDKLGPILLQLPPNLTAAPNRLDAVLRLIPTALRVVVEPRHESWWSDEVRAVLAAHRAALCWADRLNEPVTPLWRTTDWAYVRFHEGTAEPWPCYSEEVLSAWVRRIGDTWDTDRDVYVYFNNDPGGAAIHNAVRFAAFARAAGWPVTRTPAPLAPAVDPPEVSREWNTPW
ncbi:DUF72 domain-containing protein [Nocardia otitidiscaviarum]|uniref:DUF72 domain-containing protein n=1 Tax=Nocardia otitidiscaviarum TaxID=1823 RepID=UPI000694AFBE|nr:DUF72 domain-containing protein [Nocardia otitidiscaviarum]MBF6135443.1 DUF72 domain-containing protein [Nocardia otitidiscaviarum]MBF6487260.1 DUF72 domain-containing protein [Nocardia otitidiscaviarum]